MKYLVTLVIGLMFIGCAKYEPVANMGKLNVQFADSKWDGKRIPKGQQCGLFGGKGVMPKITVSNIPLGANAIIVEMNDEHYAPLSSNGGHGKIGYWIDKNTKNIILPEVQGETSTKLPTNVFIESSSRSTGRYATNGYLPPCSGGKGHMYHIDVKAVYKAKNKDEKSKLLAESHMKLGKY